MDAGKCLFCGKMIIEDKFPESTNVIYHCVLCGFVNLTSEAYDDFNESGFSDKHKKILSIILRNQYERSNHKPPHKFFKIADLRKMIDEYTPLNPLEKMDNALLNIAKETKYVGEILDINIDMSYPYYHCSYAEELCSILRFLNKAGYTRSDQLNDQFFSSNTFITAEGYQRLQTIEKKGKDSRQCFVAMWFTTEMDDVYKKAIKPAIEFKEEGKSKPRFQSIKIDLEEHNNDINDEIIAQIRRSRFIVCDLTGYRGGVYFEAGFAYGLGLDVIYTCRKDWCKEQTLKDKTGKPIEDLYDEGNQKVCVKKEGVHFDLAHRNRIEWSLDDLPGFRKKLEDRIKATIV